MKKIAYISLFLVAVSVASCKKEVIVPNSNSSEVSFEKRGTRGTSETVLGDGTITDGNGIDVDIVDPTSRPNTGPKAGKSN